MYTAIYIIIYGFIAVIVLKRITCQILLNFTNLLNSTKFCQLANFYLFLLNFINLLNSIKLPNSANFY